MEKNFELLKIPCIVLMLLATSTKFTVDQEDIVIPAIMSGFRDCCLAAGTEIRGGQTAKNPWVLLGGCATSVLPMSEIVMPNQAKSGDVLILTKPLGIRVAVNLNQWLDTKPERIEQERLNLRSELQFCHYYHFFRRMVKTRILNLKSYQLTVPR